MEILDVIICNNGKIGQKSLAAIGSFDIVARPQILP